MPEEIFLINNHSEEVNDIIGHTPSWILFRGNVVIAVIVFLLLTGSWFLKYPDIISAPLFISSYNPPIKLVAQSSGKISEFFAQDGDMVEENKLIAVIDNPANTKDILTLKEISESLDSATDIKNKTISIRLPENLQAGELQSDYSTLYEAINNYKFIVSNTYYSKKITDIVSQQKYNKIIANRISGRGLILNDQLQVEAWKDSVNKVLLRENVISLKEYNDIKKGYLNQHLNDIDNSNNMLQNKQQSKELQKNVTDIQQQYKTLENETILNVKAAAKRIKGQIGIWEKQYLLKSPSAGKLVLFQIRKTNQYVISGTPVCMIVPFSQKYEIRVSLPLYKAGKVKTGQRVLLKLNEYPYEEYGMINARVASVTEVAIDGSYSAQLRLENGLKTTRNRTIEYRPEITGTADIVTNEKNILQRIFDTVYGKLYERK